MREEMRERGREGGREGERGREREGALAWIYYGIYMFPGSTVNHEIHVFI